MSNERMQKENTIQLITYPDSLGHNLKELSSALDLYIGDVVGGVHILPFYPSSGDRGFSPLTHLEVDPQFGTWKDIAEIGDKYNLMSDLVLNHISVESEIFQDYLAYGKKSRYKDYFITSQKFARFIPRHYHAEEDLAHVNFDYFGYHVRMFLEKYLIRPIEYITQHFRRLDLFFHRHGVSKYALRKIYRPRPGSPFVKFTFADGKKRYIWCTFSEDQIDLDVKNPGVRKMIRASIQKAAQHNVRMIRLDAFGYVSKRNGSSSFLLPEVYTYITELAAFAHENGMKILPEVHSHYSVQQKLSETEGVDFVYDFQLPLIVLHTIFSEKNNRLSQWISMRPEGMITTLDTHDGLPVPDVEGFLTQEEVDTITHRINERGGNVAMRASGTNAKNLDTYQLNVTYYSALAHDDEAYIVARAIQFFIPGIPQVYYVGLLAGENDVALLDKTNNGRDINRHGYTLDEIKAEVARPVVQRLFTMMRLRNACPAFDGTFTHEEPSEYEIILRWENGDAFCEAEICLTDKSVIVRYQNTKNDTLENIMI